MLSGKVPFSVAAGNHDYDSLWISPPYPDDNNAKLTHEAHFGGLSNFKSVFGDQSSFFKNQSWYIASNKVYQILSDYQDRWQTALDAGVEDENFKGVRGVGDGWLRLMQFDMSGEVPSVHVRTYSTFYKDISTNIPEYAQWYRAHEKPNLSDEEFNAQENFVIQLTDFRARFDQAVVE